MENEIVKKIIILKIPIILIGIFILIVIGCIINLNKKIQVNLESEPNESSNDTESIQQVNFNEEDVKKNNLIVPLDEKAETIEQKIDANKPMVALTFDDGPNPKATLRILKTLQKHNAVATFFDLGICMSTYPEITQYEEKIGCEVGSHTYSHQNLNTLKKEEILKDIKKAEKVYKKVLGHPLNLIRAPYGNSNDTVKSTIKYPLINWDIDTLDWKTKNKKAILKEVRKHSDLDGKIILMHSIYETTADAVEVLVPELISKGYQLVTISEIAKYKGVNLKPQKVYYNFR